MKIAVIALGKIGLPLAVQFADRGHDVVGVDVNARRRRGGERRARAVPGRGAPGGEAGRPGACGPAARHHGLRRGGAGSRRRRARRPALRRRDDRRSRLRLDGRGDPVARRAPHAGHARLLRDHAARGHHPHPVEAPARGGLRARRGPRLPPRLQPRTGADRARLRGPAQVPQAGRRAVRGGRPAGHASSTRPCSSSTTGPTLSAATGSGTSAARRPPRWPSSPRPPTGTSTSGSRTSSRGSPAPTGSTSCR